VGHSVPGRLARSTTTGVNNRAFLDIRLPGGLTRPGWGALDNGAAVMRLALAGCVRWRRTWWAALERRAHNRLANRVSWRNIMVLILRRVVVLGRGECNPTHLRPKLSRVNQVASAAAAVTIPLGNERQETGVTHSVAIQGAWDHPFSAGIRSDELCSQHSRHNTTGTTSEDVPRSFRRNSSSCTWISCKGRVNC